MEIVREAMRTGTTVRRDVTIYVEDRREHEIAVAPARQGPEPGDWLLTIRDLQPERAMAHLRREFVANVSHELKTPLTSIRGYAETLLQGGLEDEANRVRFVETIRAQAVRLEAIVEDLLELADLDRPDAKLEVKSWDLAEVVRDMAAGFEETAARRGLALDLAVRPGLRATFDRKRVEVALRNLLDKRDQVHGHGLGPRDRRGGSGGAPCFGHRHRARHSAPAPSPDLRAVLPCGSGALPCHGGYRARALHRETCH